MAFKNPQPLIRSVTWNQAMLHRLGSLTDEMLLEMTDEDLKPLAYSSEGLVRTEWYKAPATPAIAVLQGHTVLQEYQGVHRAKLILDMREESRKNIARQRTQEDKEALNSLMAQKEQYG